MQCVNKSTREYQTLLKESGLPDFVLASEVGRFLEKLGRFPYLDELPKVDSQNAIIKELKLNGNNVTKTSNILQATNSNSIEEAIPKLNNKYRDKEIEILELGETSKVYITKRPTNQIDDSNEIIKELNDIKNKAIVNGTFMKAPNGKTTNLTEKQWLMVRTKAFKKWFGDWEKVISNVNLNEVSHTGTGRTHYYEYKINNNEGYISIAVDTKNKTISITGIEAVKGKGLGINSYIALQNKFPDYTINSDEEALSVDAEKMWDRMVSNGIAIKNGNKNYTLKLPSVSKIVDENGEPLVVYHTSDADFDTFDINKRNSKDPGYYGEGFYFYTKPSSLGLENPTIKSYFLNVKNPLYQQVGAYGMTGKNLPEGNDGSIVKYNDPDFDLVEDIDQLTALMPNQIKSATDNWKFSSDDNTLRKIETSKEYLDMLDELDLVEEQTSDFIYNYMKKIINVNPKAKYDMSGEDFRYVFLNNNSPQNPESFEKLIKKIFGHNNTYRIHFDNREEFIKDIDKYLDSWSSDLLNEIENPRYSSQDLYLEKYKAINDAKLLQEYLNRGLSLEQFNETETNRLQSLLSSNPTRRNVGFKIQKLKSKIKQLDEDIKIRNFRRHSTILAAKNRLVALNTIDNLKDLVRRRLIAEYDSRLAPDSELEPYKDLYKSIRKVIREDRFYPSIIKETIPKKISAEELASRILSISPEHSNLLNLFQATNPELTIIVGGDSESFLAGNVPGKFVPRENTLYLFNGADLYTAIHEWAHAATYYGMMGSDPSDPNSQAFSSQIEQFMNYVRDYIKEVKMDPSLFDKTTVFGAELPATIYGFTNPSEFIAETFGNPAFQELLSQIPPMKSKKFKSLLHQLWDSIINFLRGFVGIQWTVDRNALDQAKKLGYTAMMLQQQHINAIYNQLKTMEESSDDTQNSVANNANNIELQKIKAEALANGTFMLAPNGKPTNLTERQWLQVRTKNFKKWFGDWENSPKTASKVVDENGEPLVVYHNTSNEFTKFSKFRAFVASLTGSNMFGRGFYFSNHQGNSLGNINMPVFLRVVNPSEGDMTSKNDGMIHSFGNGEVWYAAKNPNQIKSATDNNGDFSVNDFDIQRKIKIKKDPIYDDFNPFSYKKRAAIILSEKSSDHFDNYLIKSKGAYPKQFYDVKNGFVYIKSNNRKNSKRYDVVNPDTGEIYVRGLPLYTKDEYEDLKNKSKEISDKIDPNWKPSDGHSYAFRKFLSTPSKGLFKFAAKQYLKEAIVRDEEDKFNYSELVDIFVDNFSDDFWKSVLTSTLSLSFQGKMNHFEKVAGVTTDNFDFFENFIFPEGISKKSLIYKLEKELGVQIRGQENFGVKFTENTPYNELIKQMRSWYNYHYHRNVSTEESISMFAESHNYTVEEVKKYLESIKDDESMESSQIRYGIENFSKFDYALSKIKKEYDDGYAEYLKEKLGEDFDKETIKKVGIIFNRDSPSTLINRLATILHEPYHALVMLHGDKEINKELQDFIQTDIGRDLYESVKSEMLRVGYSGSSINEEFLACLYSYFMTPDKLKAFYLDETGIMNIIANKLISLEKIPNFKKVIQIENVTEFEKQIEHYTEEEKVTLTFFQKIQNIIARFLRSLYSGFSVLVKEIPETRIVEKTREIEVPVTKQVKKETLQEDLDIINTKNKLEDIFSTMQAMMQAPVENNIPQQNKTSMMVVGEIGARSLDAAEEATTRMDNLAVAQDMENAGKDALTIKAATGWERGADDKWRYEIPDFRLSNKLNAIINDNSWYEEYPNRLTLKDITYSKDIELMNNVYPELQDYKITLTKDPNNGEIASIDFRNKRITICVAYDKNLIREAFVHELQHFVQEKEGFAVGTNPTYFKRGRVKKENQALYTEEEKLEKEWEEINNELYKIENRKKEIIEQVLPRPTTSFADYDFLFGELTKAETESDIEIAFKRAAYYNLQYEEGVIKKVTDAILKFHKENDSVINELNKKKKSAFNAKTEISDKIMNNLTSRPNDEDIDNYRRTAGEVEARTAATRRNLSPEERRNSLFTDDMYKDVAKEDLIFLQDSLGTSAFIGRDTQPLPINTSREQKSQIHVTEANQMKSADLNRDSVGAILNVGSESNDFNDVNNFLYLNQIIEKLQDLYGINIIHISNAELNSPKWENVSGVHQAKAFIYNGNIYINTDIATIDSPLHEMLHVLFGGMKFQNRDLYEQLVSFAENFNKEVIDLYPNRTLEDINEEAFITELAKYLTGQRSALDGLDQKLKYEIFYTTNRMLDSILMGNLSVKCIPNEQLYQMNLKTVAKLVMSTSMVANSHQTLDDAALNRILANKKQELIKSGKLKEEC